MDSKTTTPSTSDHLAAMFQNATMDKAEKSEFSNSARDTIKLTVNNNYFTKEGENMVLESSDVIDYLKNVVQPFLEEVRKNDQFRSIVGDTTADGSNLVSQAVITDHTVKGDPVNVINLVPSEPSSLPVVSVADLYTRCMLKCLAGYPLYEPQPLSEFSTEYVRNGVNIGDVGFVRRNGTFDFLFNVCPSKNASINPPNLPEGFSLETSDQSATSSLLHTNCLFRSPITRTKSGEYICEGSEGAILELPEGAIEDEAMNILPFEQLAARHGVQWYKYTMTRGRKISNGSLYLITSLTKCTHWGIAVLDRKCAPGQGLRFDKKRSLPFGKSTSKYHWKGSRAFQTKVSDRNQGDAPNQCVFLRGYKIMIRQDIFDNLCNDQPHGFDTAIPSSSSRAGSISLTRQPASRIRGGGGSDLMSKMITDRGLLSWTKMSSMAKSGNAILHANFDSSLFHPSDLINAALLSQNPDAKVALTHDDVWCDLLRDNFPKLKYATMINIARSYTNMVDEYDCVTLEKYSNSVLDESNRRLQGTEMPAPKASLTAPDDDYTPLPGRISVTLPHELVERILLLLDTESMLTCKLVNREFNEVIQSSTLLQYILACKAAGVIDNPQSPLSYAERLEALKTREDAWRKLKPVFEMMISVKHQTSSQICRSTGGVYFLSDDNRKDLNYCHLTPFPQDNPLWIRIAGHGPAPNWSGILVNFVTALYEHDLIVNVISSGVGNEADMQRHSLDLVILKFSTGEYHPLAHHPRIHVQRSPDIDPWVSSRISGDNLALVVRSDDGTDKLFIFDWKTGHKRLQHEAAEAAYLTLDFISPELLLVPNRVLSHFEVWHLAPHQLNPKPPTQILCLRIPAVSPEYSLVDFHCYGESSPFFHSMPYLPPRPFFSSPENYIIVSTLRMSSNSRRPASYNLVIHRCALLDMIQKWISPSLLEHQEELSMWLTNEVTVHQIVDTEDGSVHLDAQSKLVSTMPLPHPGSSSRNRDFPTFAPSPTCQTFPPSSHIPPDSESSSVSSGLSTNSSTSRCTFLQVPWEKWGPPISRWFQVSTHQGRWFRSNGQRCAFLDLNTLDKKKLIVNVADFNPHNFERVMIRLQSGEGSNGNREDGREEEEEEEKFEIMDHRDVFSEEVYMGLKCVVSRAPGEYDFDAVVMDEQRLLGVKLNGNGWIETVKILYIG